MRNIADIQSFSDSLFDYVRIILFDHLIRLHSGWPVSSAAAAVFFFCAAQQIIDAYVIIVSQFDKDFDRYVNLPEFIFRVSGLFDIQVICQFNLFLIIIFS